MTAITRLQHVRVDMGASGSFFALPALAGYRATLVGLYGSFLGSLTVTGGSGAATWDQNSEAGAILDTQLDMQPGPIPWVRSAVGAGLRFVTGPSSACEAIAVCAYVAEDAAVEIAA